MLLTAGVLRDQETESFYMLVGLSLLFFSATSTCEVLLWLSLTTHVGDAVDICLQLACQQFTQIAGVPVGVNRSLGSWIGAVYSLVCS